MIKTLRVAKGLNRSLKIKQLISWKKDPFSHIEQSRFYKPRVSVHDFLLQNAIEFKESSSTFRVKQCIFCSKPHYNDVTNMYTLNIEKERGIYYCHRCQSSGRWMDFRAKFLGLENSDRVSILMNEQFGDNVQQVNSPSKVDISEIEYFIYEKQLWNESSLDALSYLKSRGFSQETLKKYRVGAGTERFTDPDGTTVHVKVIYFPMCAPRSKKQQLPSQGQGQHQQKLNCKIVKVKIRGASSDTKMYMRQYPPGSNSGFFGMHTISPNDKTIVITEGQFDAMAVHQKTGYPAISLPQGANSLPDHLLRYLDQFEDVILWVDNDEAGKIAEEKIGFKLGEKRTRIVKHNMKGLKDANDFLKMKPELIQQLIDNSKTRSGESILKFGDLLEAVKNRIYHFEKFIGTQISWFPFFNKRVKGIRMQELSIVSGATGCGKTTVLSQMSLDLAKKGIPVLWGSFQIKNQVLITNMLIQYSGINLLLKNNRHLFDSYAESFSQLPISWLSFHGSNDYEKVLSTIQYAIEKSNISVVVLDTLQFFLSGQAQGSRKFDLQDTVMARLRKISTNFDVHIIVVIHPRKTEQDQDIQIHSIYGSSKAAQQADNIWIVQKREHFRVFDIKKNRFDGEVGKVGIGYDKNTKSFFELTRQELQDLKDEKRSFDDIVQNRKNPDMGIGQEQQEQNFTLEAISSRKDSQSYLLHKNVRNNDYRRNQK